MRDKNILPGNRSLITKEGNLSYWSTIDGKKVKCYSLCDKFNWKMRADVEESSIGKYLPRLLRCDKDLIVEEWIEGESKPNNPTIIKKIAEDFKAASSEINQRWSYYNHIHSRIGKELYELDLPKYLMHNDLHSGNIIYRDNQPVIIDNEMISFCEGWFLGLMNAKINTTTYDPFYEGLIEQNTLDRVWKTRRRLK